MAAEKHKGGHAVVEAVAVAPHCCKLYVYTMLDIGKII